MFDIVYDIYMRNEKPHILNIVYICMICSIEQQRIKVVRISDGLMGVYIHIIR